MVYTDTVNCAPSACLVSLCFFILLHFSELLLDYISLFMSRWNYFFNEVTKAASWVIMNILELNSWTVVLTREKILFLFLFCVSVCPCPGTAQESCSVRWRCGCPVLDRGGSSQPVPGHSWAPQGHWLHLYNRMFNKMQKMLQSRCERGVRKMWDIRVSE